MPRPRQIAIQNHRSYRLEVNDDSGEGWMVTIYSPDDRDRSILRTCVMPA